MKAAMMSRPLSDPEGRLRYDDPEFATQVWNESPLNVDHLKGRHPEGAPKPRAFKVDRPRAETPLKSVSSAVLNEATSAAGSM
jgi:hypothetical protein